jgi:NAD(P)-dependent dehydrogenase (short-subunit alcohol dehydrogenase family)
MPPTRSPNVETRYAIVTGAAHGLGREIAVRLSKDKWHVAIADVDETGSRETLRLIEASGGSGQIESLDVANFEMWQTLITRLRSAWPRLDMLVNNAGVACSGAIGATPIEDWRWLIDINLFGVIHGCHASLEWLKQNPHGACVVNVASVAAVIAAPTMGAYSVAKAGVLTLSETLAGELHGTSVRVTVACPGFFRSRLIECGRFQTALERHSAETYTNAARLSSAQIADQVVRAAYRGKLYVFVPGRARFIWRLQRIAPRWWVWLMGRGYRQRLDQVRKLKSH